MASRKSAALSASVGSDATPAESFDGTREVDSDTTTAAVSAKCNVSGWACEDFAQSMGFRHGRRAQLGDFQIVVTTSEGDMPASIPLSVLSFLLGKP